jgi:haloalkane dehalogenase
MAVLRTPDSRFERLEDFDFAPNYTDVNGGRLGALRICHVDAGPRDGPLLLLMHGEPSWSYLYRKMIPVLVAAGYRCIAPDLVGFGRSDKPTGQEDYTYERHVDWMTQWFWANGFDGAAPGIRGQTGGVSLFCQDWGGLIGLRLVAAMPDSFVRVCAANTFLPTGEGKASEAFEAWRAFSQKVEDFDSGWIVNGGTARGISEGARAAYNAPFPDDSYKAGARRFPMLVVTDPDMPSAAENRVAWKVLEAFHKPFLTLFGDKDFVTLGAEKVMQARIPGTKGQPHRLIENAGHFCQEDAGREIAAELLQWMGKVA